MTSGAMLPSIPPQPEQYYGNGPIAHVGLSELKRLVHEDREGVLQLRFQEPGSLQTYKPLHFAVLHRDVGAVFDLLRAGASPNEIDGVHGSALHAFMTSMVDTSPQLEILGLLPANTSDVNTRDGNGDTPLHKSLGAAFFSPGTKWAVVDLLLQKDADPELVNQDGERPLDILRRQANMHPQWISGSWVEYYEALVERHNP